MTVYLVGAGPGDPGLLTRRAAEVLARADVVFHDRLVSPGVLALAPASAEVIDVGKRPGASGRQARINEILVERGRSEKTVVRLKGGDPFLFGRGGEEAQALGDAGVPYEVVPGVTSALAAPTAAGVPVTHRDLASSVTIVTGHIREDPGRDGAAEGDDRVDWDALARSGGTIVILMGVERRAEIAAALIAGGRDTSTPVLVVRAATTPEQETTRTTLGALGEAAVDSPATIVVGRVAGLDLSSPVKAPLSGWRVVVTRPRPQAAPLVAALETAGAGVVALPVVATADAADGGAALAARVSALSDYRWVACTSAVAVERLMAVVGDARRLAGVAIAAAGPATARAFERHGIVPDLVPQESTGAAALADAMPAVDDTGGRVLHPGAAESRPELAQGLRAKGWVVDEVEAYRSLSVPGDELSAGALREAAKADVVVFASPSAVRAFAALRIDPPPASALCIGETTATEARQHGFAVVVAAETSEESLVGSLVQLAARGGHPSRGTIAVQS